MTTPRTIRCLSLFLVVVFTGTILLPYALAGQPESEYLTLDELKEQYPDARFVQVTPEMLQVVMDQTSGYVIVSHTNGVPLLQPVATNVTSNAAANVLSNAVKQAAPPQSAQPGVYYERPQRTHHHTDVHGSLFFDLTHADWGGGDADIVLYVLIGVVVVAAFVVYTADYIYHLIAHPGEQEYWWNLGLHTSWVTGGDENGFLVGAKLSTGFEARDAHAGLTIEAGYADIDIEFDDMTPAVRADGGYVMGGPHIHWQWDTADANPSHFALELLVGGTSSDYVDLVSVARMEIGVGLGEYGRLGFMLGSIYMDVDFDESIATDPDEFSLIVGGQIGFRL
ncbi:MAG: hypothetical protein ISS31_04765 [Kiritimatiellae bacterium]|nr:hypothetical protein [Kiritimatiellia bacterium]